MMSHDSSDLGEGTGIQSRREVLGGALSVAGTMAASGVVSASSTSEVSSEYATVKDVRAALEPVSEGVRDRLVSEGILADASIDRFEDQMDAYPKYNTEVDEVTTRLVGIAQTDSRQVELHADVATGASFAVVSEPNSDTLTHVTASSTSRMVYDEDCVKCEPARCNSDLYNTQVMGKFPDTETSCTDMLGYECWREPTCDECPDQDKCNDDGGW